MNEIVVLSGKGGTGKTSITAALAVLAGHEAVIADCDVDAANMHLLMQPEIINTMEFYSGEIAQIEHKMCIICGKCKEVCRFDAIHFTGSQFQIDMLNCEGCGYCEIICPTLAISMKVRKSGNVFTSNIKMGGTMIHARLDIGAENSGKLVAEVKNKAKEIALAENKQFVIVDGSPGIGCPVVSSLSGANYVVLVTESTMSGLHDLKRVFDVIKRFRIRAGCIINKYDINEKRTEEIKSFLRYNQIDYLNEIPYDMGFTTAMLEGKTIVETNSSLKHTMEGIWVDIQNNLIKKPNK